MNDRDREVIGLVVVVNGSRGPKLHYRNPKFRSSSFSNRNENDLLDETQLSERKNIQHLNNTEAVPSSFKDISTIDDVVLEDICSLKHSRSDRRFHLEIHEIAFLGYPVRWESTMLNVVFVTRANVLTSLSNQLFELSQKAALMLLQEAEIFHDPYFDAVKNNFKLIINFLNDQLENIILQCQTSIPTLLWFIKYVRIPNVHLAREQSVLINSVCRNSHNLSFIKSKVYYLTEFDVNFITSNYIL